MADRVRIFSFVDRQGATVEVSHWSDGTTTVEGEFIDLDAEGVAVLVAALTDHPMDRPPLHEVALTVAEMLRKDADDCGPCAVSRCLGAAWCSRHHAGRALHAAAEATARGVSGHDRDGGEAL